MNRPAPAEPGISCRTGRRAFNHRTMTIYCRACGHTFKDDEYMCEEDLMCPLMQIEIVPDDVEEEEGGPVLNDNKGAYCSGESPQPRENEQ